MSSTQTDITTTTTAPTLSDPSITTTTTTATTTTTTTKTLTPEPEPEPPKPKPFRLLDLPFELVSQILEHTIVDVVSSESHPIELSFSSFSSTIIEEEEEVVVEAEAEAEVEAVKGKNSTLDTDRVEVTYPQNQNQNQKGHPGIFQTSRILRDEGLKILSKKGFFTFFAAGPGIRGIRLSEAEKKFPMVDDEIYRRMRDELDKGRNGILKKRSRAEEELQGVFW